MNINFQINVFLNWFLFVCLFTDESGCESDMAEGVEEAESNSGGDATDMLGAAMPCETISPKTVGGLKREFEAYHSTIATTTTTAASTTSPAPSPSQQHQLHPLPINLKSEVSSTLHNSTFLIVRRKHTYIQIYLHNN